jgi:polyhydroxybutyrate depolymerase
MRARCLALATAIAIAPTWAASEETSAVAGALDFGGAHRTYLIHVPQKVAASVPLVLAFHGHFGTGAGLEKLTHLDALSDEFGFIVVYPEGIAGSWNDGRPQDIGADDVGFVRALIANLSLRYHIDPKRVYATGFSNGGSFAHYLGCNLADEIAAIAPVSGYLPRAVVDTCHPARPISVLQIGGTSDPVEPFGGGEVKIGYIDRGSVLSAQETVDYWKANAKCSGAPTIKEPFGLVGLEVMAAGGIPVCGATGEEYAEPFVNAIVCDTNDGRELAEYLSAAYGDERAADRMRQAGYATANRYLWQNVLETLAHKVAYVAGGHV